MNSIAPASIVFEQERDFLWALLRTASEGVVVHGTDGNIIFCNPAARRILGLSEEEMLGAQPDDFEARTIREDGTPYPACEHPVALTLHTGRPCRNVVMGIATQTSAPHTWVRVNTAVIPSADPEGVFVFAAFSEITEQMQAQIQLREMAESLRITNEKLQNTELFFRNLLCAIPDYICLKDQNGIYRFCNPAIENAFKASESDIVGKTDYDFFPRDQADGFRRTDIEAAADSAPRVLEEAIAFANGAAAPVIETIKVPIRDEANALVGVLCVGRDVTERFKLQQELRAANEQLEFLVKKFKSLSEADPLTGLFNRRAFDEAVAFECERSQRLKLEAVMLLIDIDKFKSVNDLYGHDTGDQVLISVAQTLAANTRPCDITARLGGDEFIILLTNTNSDDALKIAARIREAVEKIEIELDHTQLNFTVSIGMAAFRDGNFGSTRALAKADAALYQAKSQGRNRVVILPTLELTP